MTEYKKVFQELKEASGDRNVTLVAVSKFHPYEMVMEAYADGARIFGENRVQEMREKFPPKGKRPDGMKVFLIGQLQRNKVRKAIEWCDRIESVDSLPLIDKIEKECEALGTDMEILLEFNSSGEEQKSGFCSSEELIEAASYASGCPHITVKGIMTIGPLGFDDEKNRRAFKRTKDLYDELKAVYPSFTVLSMGMSGDWRTALEYESDEVRIGTAIFGERV